ncbi:neither inactivation nor afterpotential protein C [Caerostris darwini]|uniref:Neither inactivation nor afterpotential protein C n=1 Tax=Caerostris darwini TaxID=1538125 RepID=A0AAV4W2Z5_9ARAC|nr:neither inactivation nor afterpotential protein C [Caerostris darwini]
MVAENLYPLIPSRALTVTVKNWNFKTDNESPYIKMLPDDLAATENQSEESVVDFLYHRFSQDDIYTYIGDILLAINPRKKLPLYDSKVQRQYWEKARSDNPPHVFAIADRAYQQMLHHKRSQVPFLLTRNCQFYHIPTLSGQKPEAKQKISEAECKRWLEKRLEKVAAKDSGRATKLESVRVNNVPAWQKFRADPTKREHENALRRERGAKKHQQTSNGLVNDVDLITSLLLQCIMMAFFLILSLFGIRPRTISSNTFLTCPVHRCICCDQLWFHQSMTLQSKSKLQIKNVKLLSLKKSFLPTLTKESFVQSTRTT